MIVWFEFLILVEKQPQIFGVSLAGAVIIQTLLNVYDEITRNGSSDDDENKKLDNFVLLWSHCFTFKIIHASMVFELLREFAERFREKDVDMILIVLRGRAQSTLR